MIFTTQRIKTTALSAFTAVILLCSCSDIPRGSPEATSRIAAAEATNRVETLLRERAQHHAVTAASITVISPDVASASYFIGTANESGLMQAASLSKAVAAAGILTLMEREGLSIDADIRDRFTSIDIQQLRGDKPLTVRELLSHTGGATQGGYPGYRRGKPLPASAAIVTDPPHRLVSAVELSLPKGEFHYSGGGYQIAQVLAEDISGQPFAELMEALVFDPLGMTASTFAQPIDPDSVAPLTIIPADSGARLSEGLFRPLREDWLDYPEQAAAGLWTTSADYARFVDAVLDAAAGRPSRVSPTVANAMLRPVAAMSPDADSPSYGLGLMLRVDTDGTVTSISHSGLNAGYRALFEADPQSERIVVSLTNAPGGTAFNREAVDGLLRHEALTQP
ncbi:MAG: serine hydrolase domain-containing protein [Pseudomonadota bacterium]